MRRTLFTGVLCAWILSLMAGGPETRPASAPATAPIPAEIESLVARFSSDSGTERQSAQDRLVELGQQFDSVIPRLQELVRQTRDEEVASRAQAALSLIAEERHLGPTRITLHLHDSPAPDAFRELARQLHQEIIPDPPELWQRKPSPKVTIDADSTPFWEVMRQMCRQAGVEPDFGDNGRFKLIESTEGKWADTPATAVGPLLVRAERIAQTRTVEFARPLTPDFSCVLSLNVLTEPKMRIIAAGCSMTIESAVDEKNNSLLPEDADDPPFSPFGDHTQFWEAQVDLMRPAKSGLKIAQLKGTVHLLIPDKIETLDVPAILGVLELEQTICGRRLTIHKAQKIKGGYEVQVTLFRNGLSDAKWKQWRNPLDMVRLVDAQGLQIYFSGVTETTMDEQQCSLTIQFENPNNMPNGVGGPVGPPAKLRWEVPRELRELQIPFQFRDLPLP